jgi:hypothetical protein
MTHDKFNALVRETAEAYHIPELHARCYIVNWYTTNMCNRCRNIDECTFVYSLEKEKEEGKNEL